jgi:phosphatidylserine/phosphatidylglycerophosphate/cardiolipin synthase-like enzyme
VARSDAIIERLEGNEGASDVLQKHLAYEQALNFDSPLVLGNKLTLLQNGPETYRAMFAAIRGAKNHINLETYIFNDDEIGGQFADLLLERQAAGVVNLIARQRWRHPDAGGVFRPPARGRNPGAGIQPGESAGRQQEGMAAQQPRSPQAAGD